MQLTDAQQEVFDRYAARFAAVTVSPLERGAALLSGSEPLTDARPAEHLYVPAAGVGTRRAEPREVSLAARHGFTGTGGYLA